jgi:predicted AAA+ superfamily ATPase
MIIIHSMNTNALPRLVAQSLQDRLRVMPAVVVTGARQTGKSTMVQELVPGGRRFFSLDDLDVVDAARHDPEVLVGGTQPVTLDEVQREPDLLRAVKRAIDRRRQPGQFLLTGSANLLLMRQVFESLAGRASYLTLWPMTRREQQGLGRCGLWEELLGACDEDWLSSITALPDFRRLMRAACLRLGQLVNQTEMGRDVALPQPTVHRYLNLLETSYLLVRLPAYAVNRTKRLIKSPKLYWGDTGVALHLAQRAEPGGAHLENLVLHDLLAWRDARLDRAELLYWRTAIGEEVDFVIEAGGRLLPIEVKATGRPRLGDATHLRTFRAEYGKKARTGLLLHTGSTLEWLAPDVLAAPWWRVL